MKHPIETTIYKWMAIRSQVDTHNYIDTIISGFTWNFQVFFCFLSAHITHHKGSEEESSPCLRPWGPSKKESSRPTNSAGAIHFFPKNIPHFPVTSQDCYVFRLGDPNLNLHLPLLLGGGTTQIAQNHGSVENGSFRVVFHFHDYGRKGNF